MSPRTRYLIWVLLLSLSPVTMADTAIPQPVDNDSRIKAVTYYPDSVVPIEGLTFTTTQIQFASDEYILNIEGGDTAAWQVTVHDTLPNLLYIKPTIVGSQTNMTVVTNKRHYFFDLVSLDSQFDDYAHTYAVRFIYPDEEKRRENTRLSQRERQRTAVLTAHQNPDYYNWTYTYNGAEHIVPEQIFDDGEFTYFRLRPGQTIPAIFAVDNRKGEESVVNFRMDGDFIVVQRTAPQFTLRHGEFAVASIFNERLIQEWHQSRRRV